MTNNILQQRALYAAELLSYIFSNQQQVISTLFLHTRALNAIDAIQLLTYSWLRAIEHLTTNGILTSDELIQLMYQPLDYQDRDDTLVDTVADILENDFTHYNGLAVRNIYSTPFCIFLTHMYIVYTDLLKGIIMLPGILMQ